MPWDPTGILDLVSCEKCWNRTRLQDLVPNVEVPDESEGPEGGHAAGTDNERPPPVPRVSGADFVPVAVIEPAVGATGPISFGRDISRDTGKHSNWERLPVPARPVRPSDAAEILPEPVLPMPSVSTKPPTVPRQRESVTLEAHPGERFTTTRTGQVVPLAWLLPPIQTFPATQPELLLSYENGLALGTNSKLRSPLILETLPDYRRRQRRLRLA